MTKAFIVHLASASSRREHVRWLAENAPLAAEAIDAVDGRSMPPAETAKIYRPRLHRPSYPFELRAGEIGCFLSHRKVWQRIVDDGLEQAVIIEDDMDMDVEVFGRALQLAERHVAAVGYIQLGIRKLPDTAPLIAQADGVRLVRATVTPLGTVGQIVSNAAARRLLEATETFDRPIDAFLQMHWITGVRIHSIVPSGLSDRSGELGGSTIAAAKTLRSRAEREWKRFFYRREIARLSRRASTP